MKWQDFGSYSRFFDFGKARQDISVNTDPEPGLELSGAGDSVALPPGILDGLDTLTIEAWVRWDEIAPWREFIYLGHSERNHKLTFFTTDSSHQLNLTLDDYKDGKSNGRSVSVPDVIRAGEWIHVAGVITPQGARLYANGQLAGSSPDLNLSQLTSNAKTGHPHQTENRWLGSSLPFEAALNLMRLPWVARAWAWRSAGSSAN